VLGDLAFTLRRSPRRTTIGIAVERDGELVLTAPPDCSLTDIARVAEDRRLWVYTKLAQKALLTHPTTPKAYVSGEGFSYLGRSYRLRLIDAAPTDTLTPPLRFQQGRFQLRRDAQPQGSAHFVTWYTRHAQPWLTRRVAGLAARLEVAPVGLEVRDLGFRWGSCSTHARLHFHWRVMLLPPRIIDYIIAHELVHLHEPHHAPAFWARLERALPDFAARKQWLAEQGGWIT